MTDRRELGAIFLGGAAGALVRVWLGTVLPAGTGWPWSTFAINVSGSFALAAIAAWLRAHPSAGRYWRPLLGAGLCGAYTTFSTLQVQLLELVEHHRGGLAAGYGLASLAAGLGAVWLGGRVTGSRAAPPLIGDDL